MQMAVFVPAQHSTLQTPWGPAFLGRQGNTWLDMSTDWVSFLCSWLLLKSSLPPNLWSHINKALIMHPMLLGLHMWMLHVAHVEHRRETPQALLWLCPL